MVGKPRETLGALLHAQSYTCDPGLVLALARDVGKTKRKKKPTLTVDAARFRLLADHGGEWRKWLRGLELRRGGAALFHSKAWLYEKGLVVGSGNLGWAEQKSQLNAEVILRGLGREAHSEIQRRLKEKKGFLVCAGKDPLEIRDHVWQELQTAIKKLGALESVHLLSPQPPSWHLFGKVFGKIRHTWLIVAAEGHVDRRFAMLGEDVDTGNGGLNVVLPGVDQPFHAKAILAEGLKDALLYVGSANFTGAAWALIGMANIETGVLLTGPRQELAEAFRGILAKDAKGKPQRWRKFSWAAKDLGSEDVEANEDFFEDALVRALAATLERTGQLPHRRIALPGNRIVAGYEIMGFSFEGVHASKEKGRWVLRTPDTWRWLPGQALDVRVKKRSEPAFSVTVELEADAQDLEELAAEPDLNELFGRVIWNDTLAGKARSGNAGERLEGTEKLGGIRFPWNVLKDPGARKLLRNLDWLDRQIRILQERVGRTSPKLPYEKTNEGLEADRVSLQVLRALRNG